jgi:ABC-type molybdate transport system substrate-binding protein
VAKPTWSIRRRFEFVGIPEELQTKIGFAAGLATSAKDSESAKALIRFLTAPAAAMTLRAKGVDPI